MASTIISNTAPFGGMTNAMINRLIALNTTITRLQDAIATASAGFDGTPGTEFESTGSNLNPMASTNLFGVQPDPDNPGAQGQAFAYAVGQLANLWNEAWPKLRPYVDQLDNGVQTTLPGQ